MTATAMLSALTKRISDLENEIGFSEADPACIKALRIAELNKRLEHGRRLLARIVEIYDSVSEAGKGTKGYRR